MVIITSGYCCRSYYVTWMLLSLSFNIGPPINKAHFPKVEVYWRRTQKVVDSYHHPSPVRSTFNLRYLRASSNNFVRRSITHLWDSTCCRDSIRWSANSRLWIRSCCRSILVCCWPSVRSFNDYRRGIKISRSSSFWSIPRCRPACRLRLSRLPPLLVTVGALDTLAAPVLLVRRCHEF